MRLAAIVFLASAAASAADYSPAEAARFLGQYCAACHTGETAAAKFRIPSLETTESFRAEPDLWTKLTARLANAEMPPRGAPAPGVGERQAFLDWADATWRAEACAAQTRPPHALFRRLNRDEYAATLRDLLDLQLDVSAMLPADGPGGEGFDNAAETLFLSPLHAEKYLDIARTTLDAAMKEFKSRRRILTAQPGGGVSEAEAARRILENFLPRAFRRPVDAETVDTYATLFAGARERGADFEAAVLFALRAALVSPMFLFHLDSSDPALREYALASRLSYFLWGTMPDELLMDLAAAGKLSEPKVLRGLIPAMLRNPRSLDFATRFVEQWLRTREIETDKAPDPELFPEYAESEELRSDIRLQPVFFFREVFAKNRSLRDFLDSDGTILSRALIKFFNIEMEGRLLGDPRWMTLPEGVERGGLLSMPVVLAVSSYPYRTSPVLRGTWILDSILGSPAPPAPPDVPPLDESASPDKPRSVREKLAAHRENAVCASCHNRIDPLGFALENYDVIGRWRDDDHGAPIDASGELPDGTKFDGPRGLKQALIGREEAFVRNLTRRMLGYALGRGLTPGDACTVERIVERVLASGSQARVLIEEIVTSDAFRAPPARETAEP